ncbi:MAG: helix-turn-helix domain-containing protein [Actinomycetota bacterium]|nr:helix-turn-helix domain-containing protein [Actinomycetota bacterium]
MQSDDPSRLRAARLAAGLSREAAARRCDPPISAQTVRHAEHGMCSAEMLRRIADALGVDVEDIR